MGVNDRTILPEMEQSAVEARLHAILSRDWRAEAQAVMDERRRTGVGEVSLSLGQKSLSMFLTTGLMCAQIFMI